MFGKKRMLEMMISLHKKVDVNALSDDQWRAYQRERRDMEAELSRLRKKENDRR